ncbi:MAG: hypothetical protein MZV64_23135 [Ignavibacteriales bacterium]|nr:hypothetical protein [Ignavibacteriales bacterium]
MHIPEHARDADPPIRSRKTDRGDHRHERQRVDKGPAVSRPGFDGQRRAGLRALHGTTLLECHARGGGAGQDRHIR